MEVTVERCAAEVHIISAWEPRCCILKGRILMNDAASLPCLCLTMIVVVFLNQAETEIILSHCELFLVLSH